MYSRVFFLLFLAGVHGYLDDDPVLSTETTLDPDLNTTGDQLEDIFFRNESFQPCNLPARKHCYGNFTGQFYCLYGDEDEEGVQSDPTYYIDGKEGSCYPCFMPHQCLENNRCAKGTDGPTCEKCKRGSSSKDTYYRVGNSCQPCYDVPFTVFVLLFFLIPVFAMIIYNGLTVSVAIKIRQMVSMMQLVMLTLSVKVLWQSKVTLSILQQFGFILGSVESSFMVGCYNEVEVGMHIFQWLFIISCSVCILGLGTLLDLGMKRFIKFEPDEDLVDRMWRYRIMMRRLVFALTIMLFSPLLSATCQSYSCAAILKGYTKADKDYYLFNQDDEFTCEHHIHQFVNMVLFLLALALCIVAPPMMIFAGMVGYKWNTLDRDMVLWGWYYESFKPRFAFWEALPLMLRLVYVAATDVYDISPRYSLGIMLACTLIYLVAVCVCRPYKEIELVNYKVVDMHNAFEGISVLGVALFQTVAFVEALAPSSPGLDVGYSIVLVFLLLITLVWLFLCGHTIRENPLIEFEDLDFPTYAIQEGNTDDLWNMNLGGLGQRCSQGGQDQRRRRAVNELEAPPAALLESFATAKAGSMSRSRASRTMSEHE